MIKVKADLKGEFAMCSFFTRGQVTMMPNHTALITMRYIS